MRAPKYILLLFFYLFPISLCEKPVRLPKNVVQSHIKNNVDYSVDPCDDFYAHACPASTKNNFMLSLIHMKQKVVEDFKSNNKIWNLPDDDEWDTISNIREFIKSGEFQTLCAENEKLGTLFARHLLTFNPYDIEQMNQFNAKSCVEKMEMVQQQYDPTTKFIEVMKMIRMAIDDSIANTQLKKIDEKLRGLFKKMKLAVMKQIKITPWTKRNGAVKMYQNALQKINFTTFADLQNNVKRMETEMVRTRRECRESFEGDIPEEVQRSICDVVATGEGFRALNRPLETIDSSDLKEILEDKLQMWNSKDNQVYLGNDFMFMANTDYLSDLYGGIGFSLTHEILHSLVFDYKDVLENKPLVPFWTKDAGCVEEQTRKTCETFPTSTCNSTITFEEDAADLAAYRIVWDVYQKTYARKTVVPNYESLDNKQLFFYGAAVVFCRPNGMDQSFTSESHSNNYQRVNSLMSQMDAFSDAFKCKPTDKMVMNKARHCELYGSKAQRKNSIGK